MSGSSTVVPCWQNEDWAAMPESAIDTHSITLQRMKYTLKTMFGISEACIQSNADVFLFGTGQGSGASPATCLTLSVVLLSSLQAWTRRGHMDAGTKF
jgi:hypothetical protein